MPFSDTFLWIDHIGEGKIGAKIYPFEKEAPISFIASQIESISAQEVKEKLKGLSIPYLREDLMPTDSPKNYHQKIELAQKVIQENLLSKMVISRPIIKETMGLDIAKTYLHLCENYPNTLAYFFITEEEAWIGVTPEILGKYHKKSGEFYTMSLAGTLPVSEEWGTKELEEQKPVTLYLENILKKYSQQVSKSETYTHLSGNIKHLRTDLTAVVEEHQVENLISDLHPTPAVCGIPKNFCLQKIKEIEGYQRGFYTGYLRIDTEEELHYFVNLRCAKLYQKEIVAFAGGGITPHSIPEKEWRETELKSQAILDHIIENEK